MSTTWTCDPNRHCQRCSRPDAYPDDQLLRFELRLNGTYSRDIHICRACAIAGGLGQALGQVLGNVGASMIETHFDALSAPRSGSERAAPQGLRGLGADSPQEKFG